MSLYMRRAMQLMADARPSSGFRPETPEEWRKLQRAHVEMNYAVFRQSGVPKKVARELAQQIYGGLAGMQLLDLAFSEDNDD